MNILVTKRIQETATEQVSLDWADFGRYIETLGGFYDGDPVEEAELSWLLKAYLVSRIKSDSVMSINLEVLR